MESIIQALFWDELLICLAETEKKQTFSLAQGSKDTLATVDTIYGLNEEYRLFQERPSKKLPAAKAMSLSCQFKPD